MPDKDIKRIADYYGLCNQMDQTEEELAELIQAISKLRRAGSDAEKRAGALDHVAEEMADVHIMVEQLSYLLNLGAEVVYWRRKKIDRTLTRMWEEQHGD